MPLTLWLSGWLSVVEATFGHSKGDSGALLSAVAILNKNECGNNGMEQRNFTTPQGEQVVILAPTGRLDITTAWQFRLKLQDTISAKTPHILINLSEVNFIDSSGLTSLVAGMRDTDKIDGSFRISNVHPEAKLVFEVTMMDSVFEIYDTEEEALTSPYKRAIA